MYKTFFKQGNPSNVSDLEKQTFYRFIQKSYIFHPMALGVLLYAIGGVPLFLWAMCVRVAVTYQETFMVNSICHTWGKRQWNTGDLSKNNGLVALITFGEGWHNNHNAFEYSARHGHEWWQIDFGWYFIMFLQKIGLATDVKLPSSPQVAAKLA
ncbi:unnamed protein product [Citrullus colocynthis]|uniref:Fatty acid desaturase domain-containing protein n=1 Tax=Citrullus colocynthis TaxID=252529 RepID=A0ABP0Z520_9ROSI